MKTHKLTITIQPSIKSAGRYNDKKENLILLMKFFSILYSFKAVVPV